MFEYKNINKKIKSETGLYECLNAIGILENLDWKQTFQLYVNAIQRDANGPSEDDKNIRSILKEAGYSVCFDKKKFKGYALLHRGSHFYALVQEGRTLHQYGITDPRYIDELDEYYMYIKDFQHDYSKTIRKEDTLSKRYVKNENLNYSNLNPVGKLVGDCSIRALAKGFHIGWNDALSLLANQAFKMNELHFNSQSVVEKVLEDNGFKKHKYFPVKLTCLQFCSKMDTLYPDADILVYAGDYHITALTKENNRYIIQDSWDCSNEIAGYYFTKEKIKETSSSSLKEEQIIIHPSFGEGIVYKQEKNKLYILFDDTERVLMEDWVLKNCKYVTK